MKKTYLYENINYHWNGTVETVYYYANIQELNKSQYVYFVYSTTVKNYTLNIGVNDAFERDKNAAQHCVIVAKIVSTEYDENFLKSFAEFYLPYYKHDRKIFDSVAYYSSDSVKTIKAVDKLIQNNNGDYSREDIVKLFIELDTFYKKLSAKDLDVLVSTYMSKFPDNNFNLVNRNDRIMYFRPYFAEFDSVDIESLGSLNNSVLKLGKDVIYDFIKIYDVVYRSSNYNMDDMFVDVDKSDTGQRYLSNIKNKLPAPSVKFYDFINTLTVGDVIKVVKGNIPSDISATTAVRMANSIVQGDNFEITQDNINAAHESFEEYKNKTGSYKFFDLAYYFKTHIKLDDKGKFNNYLFLDCLNSAMDKNLLVTDIDNIFKILSNDKSKWFNNNKSTPWDVSLKDYIIFEFLYSSIDSVDAVNLMHDVSEYKPLTYSQWLKVIDNYDEYKDLPVSWWIELL